MNEQKAKVVHYTEVPAQEVGSSAPGATIRWLIDDDHDGAPVYALRMVELEPGGSSPKHQHPYEHENFVVEGVGKVLIEGEWRDLHAGDVVFHACQRVAPVRERRRVNLQVFMRYSREAAVERVGNFYLSIPDLQIESRYF